MNAEHLCEIRHSIHAHPETGNKEFETAGLIEAELHRLGIETCRLTETGVMGVLRTGRPGKTVALRADMDALPLQEESGAPFASLNHGVMHACGHDIHVTAALGAAMLLAENMDALSGEVRFLFQPDEEGNGGAQRLTEAGALKGCDAVFGGHVEPALPEGTVGVRYGKFFAASDMFNIMVTGKSCHGAVPENGIDALYAAALLAVKLKHIPESFCGEKCVVTVGKFNSGTARNILAGTAEMSGIMRTLGADSREKARRLLYAAAKETEAETGATVSVELIPSYPGVVNHDAETAFAEEAAREVPGVKDVVRIPEPTMTTEDFGYYLMEVPGTFINIGTGGEYPLHNPKFCPKDEIALTAARVYAHIIGKYLSHAAM